MKHHELIQLRKQRVKTLIGYTPDGKKEIYITEMARPDLPRPENIFYKFSARRQKRFVLVNELKAGLRAPKVKIPRYVRPPGPRKISHPRIRIVQEWRKEPRRAYCTGCGYTFTHMHLLFEHRRQDKCGGRFLPGPERELLDKLRLEREALDRRTRALDNLPPIQPTKAEKKARRAARAARREEHRRNKVIFGVT